MCDKKKSYERLLWRKVFVWLVLGTFKQRLTTFLVNLNLFEGLRMAMGIRRDL